MYRFAPMYWIEVYQLLFFRLEPLNIATKIFFHIHYYLFEQGTSHLFNCKINSFIITESLSIFFQDPEIHWP